MRQAVCVRPDLFSKNAVNNSTITGNTGPVRFYRVSGGYGARYLDSKYSRWMSADPAMGEYVPQAPVGDEAKKRNENLPGGGVYNTVNFHSYHYAGNNPVKYTDPDGEKSGLATDSDGVPIVGHSAMYVEVYDSKGNSIGFELYEVGPTNLNGKDLTGGKTKLSSNKLDSSAPFPLNFTKSGNAWKLLSSVANLAGLEAGVTVESFKTEAELKVRLSRYDNVTEFSTTQAQDKKIQGETIKSGRNFGKYNLFTNNCVQYASKAIREGGIKTSNNFVPNLAHRFADKNNRDIID